VTPERDPHSGTVTTRNLISLAPGCKPSKVLSTRAQTHKFGRGLSCAFLHPTDDGLELFATNTFGLARIPVTKDEGKVESSAVIPRDALAHAEKLAGKRERVRMEITDTHVIPCDRMFRREPVWYEFGTEESPDFKKLMESKGVKPDTKHYLELGFNPTLLSQVAAALGSDMGVKTTLYVDTTQQSGYIKAIEVTGLHSSSEATGLLMPVRVNI
jgi:DNA polymerase III sliding clamp (beta) subunit (PCNA family)